MIAWIVLMASLFLALYYAKLFNNLGKIWMYKTSIMPPLIENQIQTVSIVIAFRNEYENLNTLVQSLRSLDFPLTQFELIFIDDQSTDNSSLFLQSLLENSQINYSIFNNPSSGKKSALALGATKAKYEKLLFTDADVAFQPGWIQALLAAQSDTIKMVCGPVVFANNTGFFDKWKQLEFIGLICSGAAYIAANKPILANGANLLINKSDYLELLSKHHGSHYASGDDVFLLHTLHEKHPGSISFAFDKEAIVRTNSPQNLLAFVQQRLRWASKATGYKNADSIFLSVFVLLYSLMILVSLILSFWQYYFLLAFLVLFSVKLLTDWLFFKRCLPFYNLQNERYNYLLGCLIHMIYIPVIAALTFIVRPTWKGRKI